MRVIALVVLLSGCLPVNNVDARKHGARKLRCNDGHSQIVIPSKGAIGTLTTGRDGLVTTTAASSAGLGSPSPSSSSSSSSTIPANNASGQIPTAPSSATSKNLPPSKQTTKAGRSTATSASARPSQPAPTSSNPAGSIKTTYTGPTSGRATFYGDDGNGGTCKLPARSDKMFVAWPGAAWKEAEYCGACLEVKGDKGSVKVQVTNKCPECPPGNLDLSTTAFNKIISTPGVGPISWKFISCTDAGLENGKLQYFWKSGSTQYWAQVQVRGGALPIHSVEVKGIGSSGFVAWKRQDYNYFGAPSAPGAGPFTVMTTFQDGTSVTDTDISLNGNVEDA